MIQVRDKALKQIVVESLKDIKNLMVLDVKGIPHYLDVAKPTVQIEIICAVIYNKELKLNKLAEQVLNDVNEALEIVLGNKCNEAKVALSFDKLIVEKKVIN